MEVRAVEKRLQDGVVDGRVFRGERLQLHLGRLAGGVSVLEFDHLGLGGRQGGLGVQVRGVIGNGGFAPLLSGDLAGNVGAGQGTTVNAEGLANGLREQVDTLLVDIDTLDALDTTGIRQDLALNVLAGSDNELVRQVEHKDSAVLNRIHQIRVCVQVVRQVNSGQVLDVLVLLVNHVRQLLSAGEVGAVVRRVLVDLDVLLKHPHLDLLFEDVGLFGGILGDDLGDSAAPT